MSNEPATIKTSVLGALRSQLRGTTAPSTGILPEISFQFTKSSFSALIGVSQNDTAPRIIDNPPLFDLFQRPKAAETDKVIIEAAILDAR